MSLLESKADADGRVEGGPILINQCMYVKIGKFQVNLLEFLSLESNPGMRILESSLNHLLADGRATKDLIAASIEKLAIDRRLLAASGSD